MPSNLTSPVQWLEPTFHPTYARLLCNMLRARGVDIGQILANSGLSWDALVQGNDGINFVQIRHIIQTALRVSETPALGLVLGSATPASAHGAVGYAALAAQDVAQALTLLGSYARLRIGALDLRLVYVDGQVDGQARWHANAHVNERANAPICRIVMREQFDLADARIFICEAALVVIVRLLETILGQRLPQLEYRLPYPKPAWHGEYAHHLDGTCCFDAACLEIRLPTTLLHAPCLTADPHALASARKDCEQGLAQLQRADNISQQVRRHLADCNGNYPGSSALARALNMSLRTLVRKLAHHGTSYQALLDEARKESAQWYLQHTGHTVETIAERLGYRDTSNFSRCCKRWFGVTPSQVRQQK
jgi:AraC-like DNA-binding protein